MTQYILPSGSFTRPADVTAYASGDLMANSTTAGSVAAVSLTDITPYPGSGVIIKRVVVSKSGTSVTNASVRLHLYTASPTAANGDNGAFSTDSAANYLGQVDVTIGQTFTDGASGSATTAIATNSATVYALLEARAAYTPASGEVFTIALEVER